MTHTPGPWAINENGDIVKDGARFTIAALLPGAGVTSREVVANTRLITAAPDLLEALKAVTEEMEWRPLGHTPTSRAAIAAARAAIAKADGTEVSS